MEEIKEKLAFDEKRNLQFTGERYIPNETSNEMKIEHMQRYLFAKEFVKNKVVLDAACGEGYGSHILKQEALQVYAIDIDDNVINAAKNKYGDNNIKFNTSSINRLPFENKKFDTIISFETIEHVDEETQQSFLNEVDRTLKDDGLFIISTPNKEVYTDRVETKNPHHKREFYKDDFLAFLSRHFEHKYIFNQYLKVGYFLNQEGKGSLVKFEPIEDTDSRYYIVVCSHKKLDINISKSYEVFNNNMYFDLIKSCNKLDKEMVKINKDFKDFRRNSKLYTEHLEKDIRQLKEMITHKDRNISELKKVVAHRDEDIKELKKVVVHRDEDINELKKVVAHRDNDIKELNEAIQHIEKENEALKEVIKHPINNIVKKIFSQSKK